MNVKYYLDILIEYINISRKKLILFNASLYIILYYDFKLKALIVIFKITVLRGITLKKDIKFRKRDEILKNYLIEIIYWRVQAFKSAILDPVLSPFSET